MLIKVCGMKEPGNIGQVATITGVDLIGLIFYELSPRYVDSDDTALSVASLTTVKVVGVFVNATEEEVAAKCKEFRLDYIQLHGIETPEYLISLREQLPGKVKIIKAFPIQNSEDLKHISGYEGLCDYFLSIPKHPATEVPAKLTGTSCSNTKGLRSFCSAVELPPTAWKR